MLNGSKIGALVEPVMRGQSGGMSRNIYDNQEFFDGYSQLPRSQGGLAEAPEWPAVRALLPDLRGARILDLGCGFGAFDRWAIEQGATSVVAIDLSQRMLARARDLTASDKIRYLHGDLADLAAFPGEFDLIYSALAFHYIADFAALCRNMRQRLQDSGCLVATLEHPIYTAPVDPQWLELEDGRTVWPLDGYLQEGLRVTNWIAPGVEKYHRTMGSYFQTLLENGFVVRSLVEWAPDAQQLADHPEWAREVHRPLFLLLRADAA